MNFNIDINRLYILIGQLTVEKDALIVHISELEKQIESLTPKTKEFSKEVIREVMKDEGVTNA